MNALGGIYWWKTFQFIWFKYYFYDLRKYELFLSRQHSPDSAVMVWNAIMFYETIDLFFNDQKMNDQHFKILLDDLFRPISGIFSKIMLLMQERKSRTLLAKSVVIPSA